MKGGFLQDEKMQKFVMYATFAAYIFMSLYYINKLSTEVEFFKTKAAALNPNIEDGD